MDISIIPKKIEVRRSVLAKNKFISYLLIIIAVIAMVGIYSFLLYQKMSLKKTIEESKVRFSQNESSINQELGSSSYVLADKLNNLSTILSNRLYWSNFFGKLDKIFNPEAVIKSSQLDAKNLKVTVSGSMPSYDTLQKQLDDLGKNTNFIQDFSLIESSFSENTINFRIDINFKKDVLKRSSSL